MQTLHSRLKTRFFGRGQAIEPAGLSRWALIHLQPLFDQAEGMIGDNAEGLVLEQAGPAGLW